MFDRRREVWRRRGERFEDCCVQQVSRWGGGSVMVWGGISWRHKTQLIVVDGNLTARRYINEILEPEVVPFLRNNGDVMLFQQDKARAHSARLTMDFFNQNGLQVLPWLAFSPDLNPIEHLWDQLGKMCTADVIRQSTVSSLPWRYRKTGTTSYKTRYSVYFEA